MPEYLNNHDLYKQLQIYHKDHKTEELTKSFYLIATNLTLKYKFSLVEREDYIQNAVMMCIRKIKNYNMQVRPIACFSFFTAVALNSFRQDFRSEKAFQKHADKFMYDYVTNTRSVYGTNMDNYKYNEVITDDRKLKGLYTATDVAKIICISCYKLRNEITKGVIDKPTHLHGIKNYYNDEDIDRIRIIMGKIYGKKYT